MEDFTHKHILMFPDFSQWVAN